MGKGEIARDEQFLLFPQCFRKACFPAGASEVVIVWEWVKISRVLGRSPAICRPRTSHHYSCGCLGIEPKFLNRKMQQIFFEGVNKYPIQISIKKCLHQHRIEIHVHVLEENGNAPISEKKDWLVNFCTYFYRCSY